MSTDLFTYYSIDECTDTEKLYLALDELVSDGKIDYEMADRYVIKITDLDLEESEIVDLSKTFDSLDVFPYLDYDDSSDSEDDSEIWGDDFDE